MTILTKRERCTTFPLDQLLDARRRRVLICLACADDSEDQRFETRCINCGMEMLTAPEEIIAVNLGPKP